MSDRSWLEVVCDETQVQRFIDEYGEPEDSFHDARECFGVPLRSGVAWLFWSDTTSYQAEEIAQDADIPALVIWGSCVGAYGAGCTWVAGDTSFSAATDEEGRFLLVRLDHESDTRQARGILAGLRDHFGEAEPV